MALEDKVEQIRYFVLINLPKYHDLYLLKFTEHYFYCFRKSNGPRHEKTCLREFAKNKGTDQPAHPRSLISAFVIRFLESTISKLCTSEILIL